MCGISAIVNFGDPSEAMPLLDRLHGPIRHRGPDGEGFLVVDTGYTAHRFDRLADAPSVSPRVLCGFRRLKILDLTEAAAQPIRTLRGNAWLTFNGEIYNYRELRDALTELGYRFRSTGDAEVALAAYEEWGTECFRRFDGMWAMVIVDLVARRVVVSRDRLGIKPLYWSLDRNRLFLASEIKQILAARQSAEANARLVGRYLRGDRTPCYDETFFRDIEHVPTGCWSAINLEGPISAPTFQPFWRLADFVPEGPEDYDTALRRVNDLLEKTVESHRQADVKTGCLLSGGLDSGVLTAMMARREAAEGKSLPTFSFGFRERAPRFCEMPYVDAIAAAYPAVRNYETTFDGVWVGQNAARVIRTLEEPSLAIAALAQNRVFELCRQHDTTVVLDGEGSDEIFAGYPIYHRSLLIDLARHGRIFSFAREFVAMSRSYQRSFAGMFNLFVTPAIQRRMQQHSYPWLAGNPDDYRAPRDGIDYSRDPSLVNRQLYHAVRWGNVKMVVGYTDKNAMAHSVEARVPYLDHHIVEAAFRLPDYFKAGRGQRKRVLRDIGRSLLPAKVVDRTDRMGFGVPDEDFLRDGLWPKVRETLSDSAFDSMSILRRQEVRQYLDRFQAREHNDVRAIWRLYAFAIWRSEFGVTGI